MSKFTKGVGAALILVYWYHVLQLALPFHVLNQFHGNNFGEAGFDPISSFMHPPS